MIKSHLWAESEIQEVGSKYGNNILFKSLRPIALEWARKAKQFSLSGEELFYHALYSLDTLRGEKNLTNRIEYCETLRNEMLDYLSHRCEGEANELENMASLVALTVAHALSAIDYWKYHSEIMALCKTSSGGESREMCQKLMKFEDEDVNEELRQCLVSYVEGDSFLSDEIENLVNQIRERRQEEQRMFNRPQYTVHSMNVAGDLLGDNAVKQVNNYK